MKTRLPSVVIFAAALSVSAFVPLSAAQAPQGVVPIACSVRSVDHLGHLVTRGTTTLTVLQWLGVPHRKLSDDTWIYYGYHADSKTANDQQCDTLVLTIVRGEVVDINVFNDNAVNWSRPM